MRAIVYTGPRAMEMQEAPDPAPGEGESLIEIEAVGICGSDMHGYLGHDDRRPPPLILGHEAAGRVIEGALAGKRVTVNPLVPCGTCPACREGRVNICPSRELISMPPRQGAFAERLVMPDQNLVEVPDGVDIQHAALTEPLAVCWHTVRLGERALFGSLSDAKCLVIGGGAIGFGSALCLQVFGASDVTVAEMNPARRDYVARRDGLNTAAPDDVGSSAFDLVIDAVGYDATRELASRAVLPGGVICHVGLGGGSGGVDVRRMTLQDITFIGTYCYTAEEFRETAQAIFDGRFGSLDWAEQMPLEAGPKAFEDILAGKIAAPKVVLVP